MTGSLDRRTLGIWLAAFVLLAIAGCTGGVGSGASGPPGPQPSTCTVVATATPTSPPKGGCGGAALTSGELRFLLVHDLGPLWYCDGDSYPVARDEQQAALDAYAEMVADAALFPAVAAEAGIDPNANHTAAQKLALYRLWKVARAVQLEPIGNDRFRFDYLAQPVGGAAQGTRTAGIVDTHGAITVEQEAAAEAPMCPICLDRLTTIDTPGGPVEVDRLRIGDAVWTLDGAGHRVAGNVIALGSVRVPAGHRVVHVTLADGRSVSASPGHPLADGRSIAELRVGDAVDGSVVSSLTSVAYEGGSTYDLVVSGETGTYLAGGIPLGSTID